MKATQQQLAALPVEPDDLGELTHDAIAGDFRITQRLRGHRYSIDDVLTAFEAVQAKPQAERCLELGSGIGSVLLMLCYKLPRAQFVAVEAQRNSFALLSHNVRENALSARVRLIHGDLRDVVQRSSLGLFELITGTPPYVPPGKATPSRDAQRAYCRQELRGGVEDYLLAASRVLAPHGRVAICADARFPERVTRGATAAGLAVESVREIFPRAGKAPLFSVFTLGFLPPGTSPQTLPAWVARDAHGLRTESYRALRAFFGMGRAEHELASP